MNTHWKSPDTPNEDFAKKIMEKLGRNPVDLRSVAHENYLAQQLWNATAQNDELQVQALIAEMTEYLHMLLSTNNAWGYASCQFFIWVKTYIMEWILRK